MTERQKDLVYGLGSAVVLNLVCWINIAIEVLT